MESTLAIPVADLQTKLALFAGWPMDPDEWDVKQSYYIKDATASGLRRFYFPAPTDQTQSGYEWSFLRPLITLDMPPAAQTIQLPDWYTAVSGNKVTLAPTGVTAQPYTINWTNEGKIREMYSITPSLTGPPMYVSILSIPGTSTGAGQRFQLYFFPAADVDYTVQLTVSVAPNMLDGSAPYAWGGPAHAETILESCLGILEERLDDMPAGTGPHSIAFQQRLLASIVMDRRNKPPRMGYNRDRSDDLHNGYPPPWWHLAAPPATYNGMGLD